MFIQDIIGQTDMEIFTGAGVKENQEFKREVLEKGLPAKREVTFETELFGSKTFLIYVEPVFNKAAEIIGINYVGMEVTDQVTTRYLIRYIYVSFTESTSFLCSYYSTKRLEKERRWQNFERRLRCRRPKKQN